MKHWSLQLKILSGLLIAAALVAALAWQSSGSRAGSDNSAKVIRGDLIESAYGIGTVKAEHVFNVKLGVASQVAERYVRLGDQVQKGDKLIHLDGFPIPRAPFDGVVTALNYEVGEIVFAQTVVVTVVDLNSLYLELSMDERTMGAIRTGQPAKVSFEGQRKVTANGKVRSIYSVNSQFLVMIDFEHKGLTLLPGMTADVAITIGHHSDQLLAPLGAVTTANHLTVLRPRPEDIKVKLGATDGKYAVIEAGDLREGDQLLLPRIVHPSGPPQ